MTNQYDWLLRKTPRSVDAMRLWGANPRLDPDGSYTHIIDIAEEMTAEDADRKDFIDLAKSLAEKGFIPADPVVLWQNEENNKYYVAEGNRRVLALKLLRNPHSAPKSIRAIFTKLSGNIDLAQFEKIPVSIAPSFEDAEWYISQRNSISSLQRRWTAEQQRRWITELYTKYGGDISKIRGKIDLSEYDLQRNIRILKLKALIHDIKADLTKEEYESAKSFRFPITNFERFFSSTIVREAWGLGFDGYDISINSNRQSFLRAFTAVIKRMVLPETDINRIDSRSVGTTTEISETLGTLPTVESVVNDSDTELPENATIDVEEPQPTNNQATTNASGSTLTSGQILQKTKDNPNRSRLIDPSYHLVSDQYRLTNLFQELKSIPHKYPNSVAASIRIFLDLAVLSHIKRENLEDEIKRQYKGVLRDITLKKKLEFLKQKWSGTQFETLLSKFLNPENQYSLDVLNGYQHTGDHHFINKEFLNRFWDFLFPLFKKLVEINDTDE